MIYQFHLPPGNNRFRIDITRYKPGYVRSSEYHHLYPYEIGEIISGDAPDTSILLYDENNLKIYSHAKSSSFNYAKVVEIQKRNIGVIRREINNPFYPDEQYVWKLDSYNVVQ